MLLVDRRRRIVAVAVAIAVADGAVVLMNHDLDVIALGLLAGLFKGLLLRRPSASGSTGGKHRRSNSRRVT